MKKLALLIAISLCFTQEQVLAQTLVFKNARLLTAGSIGTIENGTLVINGGIIDAVGESLTIPANATIVDLKGKTVTPGFVVSDTLLGLVEISGGSNAAETGSKDSSIGAGYDVLYAIDRNSTAIPVARRGGVTSAIITPSSTAANNAFAGQPAILRLNAGSMTAVQGQAGVVWSSQAGKAGRGAHFVQLKAELADVRQYSKTPKTFQNGELTARQWSKVDLDALLPVIQGKKPLAVRAERASDIQIMLTLAKAENIKLILVGATEGWTVAKQIADAKVSVMVDPTDNLPGDFDTLAARSDNIVRLHQAGVKVSIRLGASPHDAGKIRMYAGMAVAQGLPYNTALQAITVNPLSAWGITHIGTLASGQQADFAVWDGDPFEPATSLVSLYINGQLQPLESRQQRLEAKYIPQSMPASRK